MSADAAKETTLNLKRERSPEAVDRSLGAVKIEPLSEHFRIDRNGEAHRKAGHEETSELAQDISRWLSQEISIGVMVPDLWDECETSERLAAWLTALGYRKVRSDEK